MLDRLSTVVYWNASAGSSERAAGLRDELLALPNVELRQPDGREAAIADVVRACREGAELVIAAGGDGTVNSVAAGLMSVEHRPLMGVLPVGTGNDFARNIGLPLELPAALDVLRSGDVRDVDTIRLTSSEGSRWYANMLTGGNSGRYLEQMTAEIKQRWGPFCYLRGVVDLIGDLQSFRIQIACDRSEPETFDALNIFIANGRYTGGGVSVSPDARLDDGMVDLVVVKDGDAGDIAGLAVEYILADYLKHPLVEFRRARRITIRSEPPLPLTADGDTVGETPLTVEVERGGLKVLAPPADGV